MQPVKQGHCKARVLQGSGQSTAQLLLLPPAVPPGQALSRPTQTGLENILLAKVIQPAKPCQDSLCPSTSCSKSLCKHHEPCARLALQGWGQNSAAGVELCCARAVWHILVQPPTLSPARTGTQSSGAATSSQSTSTGESSLPKWAAPLRVQGLQGAQENSRNLIS